MTPQERINRAKAAKDLLDSEVLRDAFAALDSRYVQNWRNATDPAERERLHTAVNCLDQVRAELRGYVTDGDITRKRHGNGT